MLFKNLICMFVCISACLCACNCVYKKSHAGIPVFNFILLEWKMKAGTVKVLRQIEQKICKTLQMKEESAQMCIFTPALCVLKQAPLNEKIA